MPSLRDFLRSSLPSLAGVVACVAAASAADLPFRLHIVNSNSTYEASSVMDVNKDGRLDIVCGGFWYEAPEWKSHWVRNVERLGAPPQFDGYSHLELDVNRDGSTDLIHVNWRSRSLYWLEHPGPALGEWKKHLIAEPGGMETGRLYDIDGDGRLDVLPSGATFAAWWELLPGEPNTEPRWVRHDLPRQAAGHGSGFGDLNGDGRGDIIGPRGWLEAPVDRRKGEWIWRAEFDLGQASSPVIVADVDDDGDNDLIWALGHNYGVFWMEQTKENGVRGWKKHLIDDSWSVGHSPLWVDMDQNGKPEFVNGKRYRAHELRDPGALDPQVIYRYEFDKASAKWNRYDIQPPGGPAGIGLDPKAADLDGDGDLDLVLPGRSGLYWYENLLKSGQPGR
jgi:hypothetical protein